MHINNLYIDIEKLGDHNTTDESGLVIISDQDLDKVNLDIKFLISLIHEEARRQGIERSDCVIYISSSVTNPCVLAVVDVPRTNDHELFEYLHVFKHVMYLPNKETSNGALSDIVAHELRHIYQCKIGAYRTRGSNVYWNNCYWGSSYDDLSQVTQPWEVDARRYVHKRKGSCIPFRIHDFFSRLAISYRYKTRYVDGKLSKFWCWLTSNHD